MIIQGLMVVNKMIADTDSDACCDGFAYLAVSQQHLHSTGRILWFALGACWITKGCRQAH
jgi:hypothetical protein